MPHSKPTTKPCSSCGAPMYWVITADGKHMPIDADPVRDGGFIATLKSDGLHVEAYLPMDPTHRDRNRYVSHFATCPNAAAHRR